MKIVCLSDLHGCLPEIPDCDILLLGGDYCPTSKGYQQYWFRTYFNPWLKSQKISKEKIIGVAGNHDWALEDNYFANELNWTYLRDNGCQVGDLKVWGSPWQKPFGGWAFNMPEEGLRERWSLIPEGTDIVLLHGPPYKIGDYSNEHCGSPSLVERLNIVRPKLVVYGHIHEGYGTRFMDGITYVNAALMDVKYKPTNKIQVIEI